MIVSQLKQPQQQEFATKSVVYTGELLVYWVSLQYWCPLQSANFVSKIWDVSYPIQPVECLHPTVTTVQYCSILFS